MATVVVLFLCVGSPLIVATIAPSERRGITSFRPYPTTYSRYSDPGNTQRRVPILRRQGLSPYGIRTSPIRSGASNYWTPNEESFPYYESKDPISRVEGVTNQTESEYFLMPNPWNGLLPWGAESITIFVVALAVVLVPIAAIVFLIVKIFKLAKFFTIRYAEGIEGRFYIPPFIKTDNFYILTSLVLNALDKYSMDLK